MLQKDLEFKEYLKLISNLPRIIFCIEVIFFNCNFLLEFLWQVQL